MNLHMLKMQVIANLPASDASFAEARLREPALAPFATPREALAPWIDRGEVGEEQYPVIRALLREYQRFASSPRAATRGARSPWSSALLVVLFPMLVTLRRRLDVPDALVTDVDTMLITALYAEAARVNTRAKTAIRIVRRAVERSLYRTIRAHRRTSRGERLLASSFADVATPDFELAVDLARLGDAADGVVGVGVTNDAERRRTYERERKRALRARTRARATSTGARAAAA